MRVRIQLGVFFLLSLIFSSCHGYTSIASIDDHAHDAWYRSSNYESQKDADETALEGCRVEARKNGIGNLAKQCKIKTRAKVPGFGAVVCADGGCAWTTGAASIQEAIDSAYETCSKSYRNCPEKNIQYWEDFAGFPGKKAEPATAGNCRPRTNPIRCQSSCINGECVISYENGCKTRVRVSPQFDGFQNQWIYPAPSC